MAAVEVLTCSSKVVCLVALQPLNHDLATHGHLDSGTWKYSRATCKLCHTGAA
jgi:hypothetical protein